MQGIVLCIGFECPRQCHLLMQAFADEILEDGTLKLNKPFRLGRGCFIFFLNLKHLNGAIDNRALSRL